MTGQPQQRLRPAGWLYWPVAVLCWLVCTFHLGARFRRDPGIRKIKGPILVISNHPSYFDPILMAAALFPLRINFLASHGFFRSRVPRFLLGQLAAIPKTQFRSDSQALKNMLRVIRAGGILSIYPEGQRSLDGSWQPVDDAIAKLISKIGCPVVLVREDGGYLTWPRWSQSRWRPGRIEVHASLLFTPEQLEKLDVPAIHARIKTELAYQDYDWQRQHRHAYYSLAPARGLHVLCHQCPACGRDLAMRSDRFRLTCRYCGNQARINRFGFLTPAGSAGGATSDAAPRIWPDPYQWHQWQLAEMARRLGHPGFLLEFPATAQKMENDGTVRPAGHGRIRLNAEILTFDGDMDDAANPVPLRLTVPIRHRNGISADYGLQFELILAEGNYRFILDDGQAVILIADVLTALKNPLDNHGFDNG